MTRWGKPIKNKKHRDPRYFLMEQSLFSTDDGSLDKEYLTQLYIKAADGDKKAAMALYNAAEMLAKKGVNFSTADGTKIEQSAIAKAYGLNVGNQSGQQSILDAFTQNTAQIQKQAQQQQDLIDKQTQQYVNQQEDMMQKFMKDQEAERKARALERKLDDEEYESKKQTQNKFNQLDKALKNDREAREIIRQNREAWQDDRDNASKNYANSEKETDDYLVLLQHRTFVNKKWSKALDNLIQKATKGAQDE